MKEEEIIIGQYGQYWDTGVWTLHEGEMIAPADLTMEELKHFLLTCPGFVYLRKDNRLGWFRGGVKNDHQ